MTVVKNKKSKFRRAAIASTLPSNNPKTIEQLAHQLLELQQVVEENQMRLKLIEHAMAEIQMELTQTGDLIGPETRLRLQ